MSARANALVLSTALGVPALLRALNGISSEIFFTGATEVDEEFRVRKARRRTYRYFEVPRPANLERWREAADRIRGPIDVRSFGRGLPRDQPTMRTIERLRLEEFQGGVRIEIEAPSFVWGMVRKVVGALRQVGEGRLSVSRLQRALDGEERLSLPLAEPERLVLWEVDYGRPWAFEWRGPNRHQVRWWESESGAWKARREVLTAIASEFGPMDPT